MDCKFTSPDVLCLYFVFECFVRYGLFSPSSKYFSRRDHESSVKASGSLSFGIIVESQLLPRSWRGDKLSRCHRRLARCLNQTHAVNLIVGHRCLRRVVTLCAEPWLRYTLRFKIVVRGAWVCLSGYGGPPILRKNRR